MITIISGKNIPSDISFRTISDIPKDDRAKIFTDWLNEGRDIVWRTYTYDYIVEFYRIALKLRKHREIELIRYDPPTKSPSGENIHAIKVWYDYESLWISLMRFNFTIL